MSLPSPIYLVTLTQQPRESNKHFIPPAGLKMRSAFNMDAITNCRFNTLYP